MESAPPNSEKMTKYTGSANTLEIAGFKTNSFDAISKGGHKAAWKYTKSCMLKQMLARDWDPQKVANVAKEKKRGWKEGVQALYRVYLVQFPYLELFCVKGHFFTFGRNQFHTFLGEISEKKTPCRSSHDHGKTS